jgi:hypothetical protein
MKTRLIFTCLSMLLIFITGMNISLCDDITIITINKETVEKIGPYPFTRDKYADFIESIYTSYSPKCVYFNLLISQHQQNAIKLDKKFFDTVAGKQNLFFSAMASDAAVEHENYRNSQFNVIDFNRVWKPEGALFPLQEIAQNGAYTSISDVRLNKNGIVEMMPTVVQIDGNTYLSTPLFLTAEYLDVSPAEILRDRFITIGSNKIKTDKNGWFEIDFGHTFKKYSYHEVLNKKAQKETIDGRIILLGIDFPQLESYLRISNSKNIAGVEVIANATQTLIDQLRE